ncbi:hypothetical protein TNCV_4794721 [Trichonephila clavipes]|nr:hypothetical protein TNCV_4794721 [Trichonephila clavipes]
MRPLCTGIQISQRAIIVFIKVSINVCGNKTNSSKARHLIPGGKLPNIFNKIENQRPRRPYGQYPVHQEIRQQCKLCVTMHYIYKNVVRANSTPEYPQIGFRDPVHIELSLTVYAPRRRAVVYACPT